MLEFKTIDLSDREWINELLAISDFRGCEYSFANNMAWRRLNDTQIARYKDFYISCSFEDKKPYFTFPTGRGDYKEVFAEMKKYAESFGVPLTVCSVTEQVLPMLNELFPDEFTIEKNEESFDYIYNAEDLIELKGKKYHNKRNHLSKFHQLNWSFEPLSEANHDECIALSVNSYNDKQMYDDKSGISEQFAIHTFLTHYNELNLKGGVLRVDEKVVAFTIGEKINSDTLCVHIEKAIADIPGCYACINNEFARYAATDCKYINREEDLGIEGLRKAKRSYYPAFMLEKSTITFKG